MAQWSHADRTLYAKIVYYGPALGGKTTNLHALHRITDPEGSNRLLSLNTADDRTLFFDLLPFELGSILGHKVAIKLYTVPGQVRYEATRRVVLSGADAVVFVADSAAARERDNRASYEDLRRNMSANRLDPAGVPVLVQLNKRDLPDAAPVPRMARLFPEARGGPLSAVAVTGEGVLETFVAACKAMLERLVALADQRTREDIHPADLARQIDRAFAPHFARAAAAAPSREVPRPSDSHILDDADLLASAVRSSMKLGDDLATSRARAARLEVEADAMRRLSDAVRASGASFDAAAIVDGALRAARDVLRAPCVSLLAEDHAGRIGCEASWGRGQDPLVSCEAGLALARSLFSQSGACVVEPLREEAPDLAERAECDGLRALAAVPVGGAPRRVLAAWAPDPDGGFDEGDLRFLATLAAHLAVGLDKARLYGELSGSRERLEALVHARTLALRRTYENLRSLEQTKDRFLSNLSHEMRTPLTAIVGAATFLESYEGSRDERREMVSGILHAGRTLDRLLDGLFRITRLERGATDPEIVETTAADVLEEAVRLAGARGMAVEVDPGIGGMTADLGRLARAVANLIDNASKFSPSGSPVVARASACTLRRGAGHVPAVCFSVLDRGPGIPADDLERIFAPFEQGGELLTGKPSGVGLGLYEARVVARQQGGMLRHLPRPEGGSEFRLVVPAAAAGVPLAAAGEHRG